MYQLLQNLNIKNDVIYLFIAIANVLWVSMEIDPKLIAPKKTKILKK